ncbi:Bug family tripartite tricarboxylate transporter substrate binding protein [Pollutimonas nitritireducens]|nr:tripartite tricarboxylate transporter substrate binding protein [Pollutimonas nitritireducens]
MAEKFPSRPVTMVVGYPPGGSNDIVARIVAPALGEALGTTIVVENRAGAGGIIGAGHVAKAKPDGYTVLLSSVSPVVLTPQTMTKAPFDSMKDLTAINTVGLTPEAIAIGPTLKVKSLKELLDLARSKQITLSSSGAGGLPHLTIELLKQASKGNIVHVPYKGAGPAVTDTLAGHVDGIVMDLPPLYALIKDGRLNALAVTSEDRVSFLADVPTAREVLPNFNVVNWIGVFAPAGTPADVLTQIDEAIKKTIARPDVKKQLENVAVVPSVLAGPEAFQSFFATEYKRWGAVLKEADVAMSN